MHRPSNSIKVLVTALTIAVSAQGHALPNMGAAQLSNAGDSEERNVLDANADGEVNLRDLVIQVHSSGSNSSSHYSAPVSASHYSSPSPSRSTYQAPRQVEAPKRYEAPRQVEAPKRYEAPRQVEAPKRYEAPKQVEAPKRYEAPRQVEAPKRYEAPKQVEAPKRHEAPKQVETPRAQAQTQTQPAPEKKSWWGGHKSEPTTPVAQQKAEAPRDGRLNTRQGGIGAQYKDVKLNDVKRSNGSTFEGTTNKGDRVRFKTDASGQQHITSVVKTDPRTGREYKAHYDKTGRRTSFNDDRGNVRVSGTISKTGGKHIVAKYSNGTTVVTRSHYGYTEKSINRGGRQYSQRTYWDRHSNRTYVRNYYYDNYGYRYYSPYWSFEAGFYTGFMFGSPWAYNPVYYDYYSGWGWYGDSWLFHPRSPYAYYFSPQVSYADPIDYVTDYVIADTVSQAYQERAEENQEQLNQEQAENQQLRQRVNQLQQQIKSQGQDQNDADVRRQMQENQSKAMITPEIKKQISKQVKAELQAQQGKTTVPMASILSDTKYMFLNTEEKNLAFKNAKTGEDEECTLTEGDIFRLAAPVQAGDTVAQIVVVTAKNGDDSCPLNNPLVMDVSSLETIKNELAQRAETAAKALHDKHGAKTATPTIEPDPASEREAQDQIRSLDEMAVDQQQP